jgi:hypothetical protein
VHSVAAATYTSGHLYNSFEAAISCFGRLERMLVENETQGDARDSVPPRRPLGRDRSNRSTDASHNWYNIVQLTSHADPVVSQIPQPSQISTPYSSRALVELRPSSSSISINRHMNFTLSIRYLIQLPNTLISVIMDRRELSEAEEDSVAEGAAIRDSTYFLPIE